MEVEKGRDNDNRCRRMESYKGRKRKGEVTKGKEEKGMKEEEDD